MRTVAFVAALLAAFLVCSSASAAWTYQYSVEVVASPATVYYGPAVSVVAPAIIPRPAPVVVPGPVIVRPPVVPVRPWRRVWLYY